MNFPSSGQPGAAGSSYAPVTYQRLMRLAARAFYSGPCPPPGRDNDNTFSARSKLAKVDTRGLGVVLVDYLSSCEWTSFELLAEALRLHPVLLSRALRHLEAGHMVRRYERRESRRKKRTVVGEALEAEMAQDGESEEEEDEEEGGAKKKGLLTEYFTLDYARAFDALQVRIQTMRASLKEQLEATNALQSYRCPGPSCGKTYTSLDAANLVDPTDLTFKCEMCGSELLEQRATNDAAAGGDAAAQHTTAKESKQAARKLLQALDRELAPLSRLMAELQHRGVPLPDPGELFEWAQRVRQRDAEMAAAAGAGGGGAGGAAGGAGGAAGGGRGAGGGGGGGASGGGGAAALLADSGVTVLSAADNTNTWEAQDFKVSLGGGGAAGGAAGKKAAAALPWFMKAADGKAAEGAAGEEGAAAAAAAAAAAEGGADKGKQQQQAEYFRDFMSYMTKLQQEKKAPEAPAVKSEPGLPYGDAAKIKAEPGLAAPPLGPVYGTAAAAPQAAAVKTEPLPYTGAAAMAPSAAGGDLDWEDVGSGGAGFLAGGFPGLAPVAAGGAGGLPLPGPGPTAVKWEPGIKPDPEPPLPPLAATSPPGGGAAADDADVEWEDV